jgi:hypothetical protein
MLLGSMLTNPNMFFKGSIKVKDEYFLYSRDSNFNVFRSRLIIQQMRSCSSAFLKAYLRLLGFALARCTLKLALKYF